VVEEMNNTLKMGMRHRYTFSIPKNKTVPHLYPENVHFKSMPKIFTTGFLVGLIEITCMQSLSKHLEEGEGSVGIHISISHISPTPPGMNAEISAKVSNIDGNKVTWDIMARDEKDIISEGQHRRFVVNWDKFNFGVQQKK
jgi:fluoroacetyl-CoA thioesterase